MLERTMSVLPLLLLLPLAVVGRHAGAPEQPLHLRMTRQELMHYFEVSEPHQVESSTYQLVSVVRVRDQCIHFLKAY